MLINYTVIQNFDIDSSEFEANDNPRFKPLIKRLNQSARAFVYFIDN
jgi:hypothetical protein